MWTRVVAAAATDCPIKPAWRNFYVSGSILKGRADLLKGVRAAAARTVVQ